MGDKNPKKVLKKKKTNEKAPVQSAAASAVKKPLK